MTNHLPEPTTIHFHGLHHPNDQDGVAGVTQLDLIDPGETYVYTIKPGHPGTFAYHSHFHTAVQDMMGVVGALIVLPKQQPLSVRADLDVMFTMQTWWWAEEGGLVHPFGNPDKGGFAWFTINGKTGEASEKAIEAKDGDLVRIRIYNGGMGVHAMHLHGQDEFLVGKNGHAVPVVRQTTQSISPGDFFMMEFVARPGNWIFHCHFPHHTANRMVSGWNGSPVGMTRIFHVDPAPPVPPEYFSGQFYTPPPGVPPL